MIAFVIAPSLFMFGFFGKKINGPNMPIFVGLAQVSVEEI